CGATLAKVCPSCGSPNDPQFEFCGECGSALGGAVAPTAQSMPMPSSTPVAEHRLVSVLFADLVGFTTLSESRDSEEVRDLLSRYFDACRTVVERYGGVVEEFVGDAAMGIWGVPTANGDGGGPACTAGPGA